MGARTNVNPLGAFPDGPGGSLSPQLLESIERACLRREYVHHHVQVVHQDPTRPARSLHAAGQRVVLALEPLEDAVVNRLGLAAAVTRADDEEVRVAENAPQVELDDIDGLLVSRVPGD